MATVSGGDKIKKRLDEMTRGLTSASSLRVGFLEGAKYPNGTPVAMIAAIQDFGAPRAGIPPRPFFRQTIATHKNEWPMAILNLLKNNNYDMDKTLHQTGLAIKGQIQQGIRDFSGVPLKPTTVTRKGFSKQLVDTGHMLSSVDYEVSK